MWWIRYREVERKYFGFIETFNPGYIVGEATVLTSDYTLLKLNRKMCLQFGKSKDRCF